MRRSLIPFDLRMPGMLGEFRREMDNVINRMFESTSGEASPMSVLRGPAINLAETDSAYEVTADLPGIAPADLDIEMRDRQLWITGHRESESESSGKTWHRVERASGQFQRVITLDSDVDADGIKAEYKDGVLHVTVPKAVAAKGKKIEVVHKANSGSGGASVG